MQLNQMKGNTFPERFQYVERLKHVFFKLMEIQRKKIFKWLYGWNLFKKEKKKFTKNVIRAYAKLRTDNIWNA